MQDRDRFGKAMAALGINCRVEVNDAQLRLFWAMLHDMSDDDFERACAGHMRASKWFPTVAELRQQVKPFVSPESEAGLAFEQVCGTGLHDAKVGTYFTISRIATLVSATAAEAFAAAGGSRAFEHEQEPRNLPFLRKRFTEAYVAALEAKEAGRPSAFALPKPALPVARLVADTSKRLEMPKPLKGRDMALPPGDR